MKIGDKIKALRKQKRMSVDELAERLGKNRATVYRYENGDIENMPYTILVPIADALGVSPAYFLMDDENIKEEDNKGVFSKNLNHYMKANNKTRKEICNDLGFSYNTFCNWVNGKKEPRMGAVQKLADYFGIQNSDLVYDHTNETNGDKLKKLRLQNNLSLTELAKELNISQDDIDDYENNKKEIPSYVMNSIANYFGVQKEDLIKRDVFVEGKHTVFSTDKAYIERFDRWSQALNGTTLTDDEFDKVIEYTKFLISQRGK